jgi:hypothetical protein
MKLGKAFRFSVASVGLAFALIACSASNESTGSDTGGVVSMRVGATGGTITAPDGTEVDIPAGALTGEIEITLTPATGLAAPPQTSVVGTAYTFGPEGTQFAKAVTVKLAFDPKLIPAGMRDDQIVVFTAPVGSTNYDALEGTLYDNTHVTAATMHFSNFVPGIGKGGDAGLDGGTDAEAGDADAGDAKDASDAMDASDSKDAPDATDASADAAVDG